MAETRVNRVKLLVTGGSGFIGSNFIRYMFKTNPETRITNIDNLSWGSNPGNLADFRRDPRYRFVKGDITNQKLVSKLIEDADVIVNFAAETHVDRSIANPRPFVKSNIVGASTVLEAARKKTLSPKIVHVSSDEVYGDIVEGSFRENDRLKPSSPYAATKAAADMLVLSYSRTYGLDAAVTRCTNNFGPWQHPEKLIPKTIIRACLNLPVPVYGAGEQIRDWIYVLDHCDALSRVIEKGKAGEIYNISGGNEKRNLEVVTSILDLMKKPRDLIRFVEDRPGHDVRYSLNSSKIDSDLDWRPSHIFSDALEETVKWYIDNRSQWSKRASTKTLHPSPWKIKW